MGRTACTESQCLYKGALYLTVELYLYSFYGPYGLYRASVPVQGWPLIIFTILLCLGIIKHLAIMAYWGMEVQLHAFLNLALEWKGSSASCLGHLMWRQMGSRASWMHMRREKSSDPNLHKTMFPTISSSHYILWATPTPSIKWRS
jgi:hypothetical protein